MKIAQYSLADILTQTSQKPFLCFLYDSSPVFGNEACKKLNECMFAGSSVLKLCITSSLQTPAAYSHRPCPVCPIHTASTLMVAEVVAVVFVTQNSITLYEHLSGANALT